MKNKYNKDLGEAFLKSAFEEAADLEFSEISEIDVEVKRPTDKQRREIERTIAKGKNKKGSKVWRAVAMIAIVFCLTFSALMLQPTVRASVFDVIITFFEDYLNIDLGSDNPDANFPLGEHTITYIPKEYGLVESKDTKISSFKSFSSNNSPTSISIYYFSAPINLSERDANFTEITVNDMKGYFIDYGAPELNSLVWGNDKYHFSIKSTLSKEEMIKIAENIK